MPSDSAQRLTTRVTAHTAVSPDAWELRLERRGLSFRAGELLTLFGAHELDARDYTIASGTEDEELWILYRLVEHGSLTPQLRQWQPGDQVDIAAPYGDFVIRDVERPAVFIATGTGIAPCVSYVRSHPALDLTILHGVRREADLFYRDLFAHLDYHPCVSTESVEGFRGRVSDRLPQLTLPEAAHFYLCGANEMIYEITDQLREAGIPPISIFHEPYYYRADD